MDADGHTAQNLSPRQHDVLRLIVRGLSNKEIARALNLAEGTVKIHVAALFGKLGRTSSRRRCNCRGRTFSACGSAVPG